ncbi:hypothetical protein F4779DRAFT_619939 [Xylariaceae sp. FL0662B]|nr:hypothetical protein F4779DRAFT_619939 [Xylariaceae sp. FL0662B]
MPPRPKLGDTRRDVCLYPYTARSILTIVPTGSLHDILGRIFTHFLILSASGMRIKRIGLSKKSGAVRKRRERAEKRGRGICEKCPRKLTFQDREAANVSCPRCLYIKRLYQRIARRNRTGKCGVCHESKPYGPSGLCYDCELSVHVNRGPGDDGNFIGRLRDPRFELLVPFPVEQSSWDTTTNSVDFRQYILNQPYSREETQSDLWEDWRLHISLGHLITGREKPNTGAMTLTREFALYKSQRGWAEISDCNVDSLLSFEESCLMSLFPSLLILAGEQTGELVVLEIEDKEKGELVVIGIRDKQTGELVVIEIEDKQKGELVVLEIKDRQTGEPVVIRIKDKKTGELAVIKIEEVV